MDFFRFFLVLGSIFGCFPANLKFILGKEPLAPLKYRHYALSVFFIALLFAQSLEILSHFANRYFSLKMSEKMALMLAVITYMISDTCFRLCGIIYGHRLSLLIDDLRNIKNKFVELSGKGIVRSRERNWFTFGTALGFTLECIHVPFRVYEWYAYRTSRRHEFSWVVFPENPVVLYPIVCLIELGGLICRIFALAIIVGMGLELLESYSLLNQVAEKSPDDVVCRTEKEKENIRSKNHWTGPLMTGESSDLLGETLCHKFFELQSCFHRFNGIMGSYAFIFLAWTMASTLLEIRELPSTDRGTAFGVETSLVNEIASVFGTVFGLVVTCLLCLLGHRIQFKIRKHKERIKFLRVKNPEVYSGKVHECLASFKWEFSASGLFVVNLSLIPIIAAAIFSFTIFYLQLEISERQCPAGGQNGSTTASFSSQSMLLT